MSLKFDINYQQTTSEIDASMLRKSSSLAVALDVNTCLTNIIIWINCSKLNLDIQDAFKSDLSRKKWMQQN